MSTPSLPQLSIAVKPASRRWRLWAPLAALCLALMLLSSCTIDLGGGGAASGAAPAQIERGGQGAVIVIVKITIQGHGPYDFALDTGASESLVDRSVARSVGLVIAGPQQQVSGIGGSETVTPVKVSQWSLGTITLPSETIASAPLTSFGASSGVVGLLGSDVLSQFGSVTINYSAGSITVS